MPGKAICNSEKRFAPDFSSKRIDGFQRPQGYRLVASLADGVAVSAGGFRRLHTLAWGDLLYIDDLDRWSSDVATRAIGDA